MLPDGTVQKLMLRIGTPHADESEEARAAWRQWHHEHELRRAAHTARVTYQPFYDPDDETTWSDVTVEVQL